MKSFFTKYRFYILILAVAAVFIIVLFAHSAVLTSALDIRVAGTYSTEFPSSENGVIYGVVDPRYLTFDRDGGYVCFDASGQRHHQGTYTVEGRVLSLSSSEGEFSAVYVDDAVYLFSSEGGVTVYTRLSTDTTYIGPPPSDTQPPSAAASQNPPESSEPLPSQDVGASVQPDGEQNEALKFFAEMPEQPTQLDRWLVEELDDAWSELFDTYDGSQFQCISGEPWSLPTECNDAIFYRADEGETPKDAAKKMIDQGILLPLTEPTDERPYTVTRYEIYDPTLLSFCEGAWVMPRVSGGYRYEGSAFLTMEEYINSEPDLDPDDELVPFFMQGSPEAYVFILLEQDGVYRLQRGYSMIASLSSTAILQ